MNGQIYDIDYLKERVNQASKLAVVEIYQGIIDPNDKRVSKVQEIRPTLTEGSEKVPGHIWQFFKQNTFGDFTAFLKPSKEVIYFENLRPGETTEQAAQRSTIPLNGIPDLKEIMDRAIARESEIEALKAENKMLKQQIREMKAAGYKFNNALEHALEFFVKGKNPTKESLQGLQNKVNSNPKYMAEEEEEKIEIIDAESALAQIYQSFPDEWLISFAIRLQDDPAIVEKITSFLPA